MHPEALHPTHGQGGKAEPVTEDLACLRTLIANLYLFGPPNAGDRGWVLIDTGIYGSASRIAHAAEERFGTNARPFAIILTHGHFDHIGAVRELAERWDVPVYAHELELPYITGRTPYPPPDPTVGGGAMAALSWLYPRGPIDLGSRARSLPRDGSVPGMPGWRWIHTPGHTVGHVALFRDADRTLIAGDAFVTTKQESALAVLTQREEINGPPAYYTPDWNAARRSVEELAALDPRIAATGHGVPLQGDAMLRDLRALARDFAHRAVPSQGRYVDQPAVAYSSDADSSATTRSDLVPKLLWGVGIALAAGLLLRRPGSRAGLARQKAPKARRGEFFGERNEREDRARS